MARPANAIALASNKLDGPKVTHGVLRDTFALVKLGYMLGNLSIRRYEAVFDCI